MTTVASKKLYDFLIFAGIKNTLLQETSDKDPSVKGIVSDVV